MGALGTFLLLVVALVGTLAFFSDSIGKALKWASGRKSSEVVEEAKTWIDDHTMIQVFSKGCGFVMFVIVALMYTWIIEPISVIYALINKVGYQPAAYIMAGIVVISWIVGIRRIKKMKKNGKSKKAVVKTKSGDLIEGTIEEIDEEIPQVNMFFHILRQTFFSLPTFYLWYLFLVLIGVLPNGGG